MRTRIALSVGVVAALVLGLAGPANAASNESFIARLSGANELPAGTGDANAVGVGLFRIKAGSGRICYVIHVRNVDGTVNGAHLHAGKVDEEGPVVATLDPPVNSGSVAACKWVGKTLAAAIRKSPRKYYLNVHSTAFVDGALRGQLRRA
jgi:hypothetical protein